MFLKDRIHDAGSHYINNKHVVAYQISNFQLKILKKKQEKICLKKKSRKKTIKNGPRINTAV